jgi:flagellar biosynthetic protein FliQ
MNQSEVIAVTQQALYMVMKVSAPILITGLIVGLVISIFQATTQINDQTLSFVPKIIAVFIVLLVSGAWMINTLIDFTNYLFIQINTFTR